jgi:RNA polymerase sigma factor (sigma-70 family)
MINNMPIGSNAESAYSDNQFKIYSSLLGQSNSELTTKLLKVTENLCKDYLSFGISQDDLLSGAYQGLVMACQNYDTNANNFLTFASHWIHIAILSELINYHFSAVPPLLMEQYKIVKNRLVVFQQKYPTTCGAQTINALLTYNSQDYHANKNELDIVEYTNEKVFEALDNTQQTPIEILCEQELKHTIELLVNRLPDNKKNIILMRFGIDIDDPMKISDIATELQISNGRVQQLYRATMLMLKEYLRGTVSTLDLCLLDERSKKILEIFMQPSSHKHDEEELGWSPDEEYKVLKLLI